MYNFSVEMRGVIQALINTESVGDRASRVVPQFRPRKLLGTLLGVFTLAALIASPMHAQSIANSAASPISLHSASPQIAQAAPAPQFIPTDVTPFNLNPERNAFGPGYKFKLFRALPERLWFNSTTEVSQRLDTNVFFTHGHRHADYAYRTLPNVTV